MNITASRVSEIVGFSVSKSKGIFTARKEYFYTHGYSVERMMDSIRENMEKEGMSIKVVDSGDIWKPFKGNASVAQSSHFFVKFMIE